MSETAGAASGELAPGTLYDRAPCGLVTMDDDGRIVRANTTFANWIGGGADVVGSSLSAFLGPGDRIFYQTRLLPLLHLKGKITEVALSLRTADGVSVPVLLNGAVDRAGQQALTHLAVFDARERQGYERQLLAARRSAERSEARTRVLQNATAAFGDSETVDDVAHALAASTAEGLGASAAAVYLDDGEPRAAGGTVPPELAQLAGSLIGSASAAADVVNRSTADDPADPAVLAALRSARVESVLVVPLLRGGDRIGSLLCCFALEPELDDHTIELARALCRQAAQTLARLRLQAQLAAIALQDSLTGLANRVLLRTHMADSALRAQENGRPLALIFVDLDDFKAVNDELGHAAGDAVLRITAARLRTAVRTEDLVCRYGGDEFIVVCQDTGPEEAAVVAERIRVAVRQPLQGDGWRRTVTASVGVTVHVNGPAHRLDEAQLLHVADEAMYRAKDRGKDQVSVVAYEGRAS